MAKEGQTIQSQLTRKIGLVYLITTLVAFAFVYIALQNRVEELGDTFSTQFLLKEKGVIASPIEREVALARKMANTAVIQLWAMDEENEVFQEMALQELENYRKHFQDRSYFFIIDGSKNYYYNDDDSPGIHGHYRYTLDEGEPDDQWYFQTMARVDDYSLNVNVDRVLETTKLWINVIVYDDYGTKIGMAGTGITLDTFIEGFVDSGTDYLTPLLIDENGFIMAYEDVEYIQLAALIREQAQARNTIFELIGSAQTEQVRDSMEKLKHSNRDQSEREDVYTLPVTVGQEHRIAAISYIPPLEWYIVSLLNVSELFSVWDFAPTILVLVLALLIISLLIMHFIRRMIVTPINDLTDFSNQVSNKQYHHRLTTNYNNEFKVLASSFNEMAGEIQEYTTNLEEQVEKRTEELTQTNAELGQKNKDMMDNISYASYLQQAILPREEELQSIFAEHFVLWQPKDVVGGDFYWCKEQGHHILFAVIDCTGHGVQGALMTMTANAVLNGIVDTEPGHSPAEILQRYDTVMRNTLSEDVDEFQRDDGLDISLCAIDKRSGSITFAGAGMDLFYVDLDRGGDDVLHLRGDRAGIGYQRQYREVTFTDQKIHATKAIVYLTSDGFLDQNGAMDTKRYTRKRFIRLLQSIQGHGLEVQGQRLQQEMENFKGDEPQRDDITVVGFRL